MVERLQVKASSIGRILTNLERKYNSTYEKSGQNMKKSPSGQSISSQKRSQNKIQQIPPFNANKIRKSPSSEPAVIVAQNEQEEIKEEADKIEE